MRRTAYYMNALSPPGAVFNLNANKPDVWTYAPDTSGHQPTNDSTFKDFTARFTWQATPRNKIALTWTEQPTCFCLETIAATVAPEASVQALPMLVPRRRGRLDVTSHRPGAARGGGAVSLPPQ